MHTYKIQTDKRTCPMQNGLHRLCHVYNRFVVLPRGPYRIYAILKDLITSIFKYVEEGQDEHRNRW